MKKMFVACALVAPAFAGATEVGHWYITPQVGGISVDNRRPVEDKEWLYGLGVGKHVSEAVSLELNLNGSKLEGNAGSPNLKLYGGTFDLLHVSNRDGVFSPYLSIGAGVARNELDPGASDSDLVGQAGIGAFLRLWEKEDGSRSFSLRPDFKVRWNDSDGPGTLRDYIATIGFQYAFGQPKPVAVAPSPPPPPAPAVVATPPPPPPAPPVDSDGDGVTDDRDQCPGTVAGVAVDPVGCPRQGSITLDGVSFENDAATLTAGARTVLEGIASDLKKYPRLRIELQGHTDSVGSDTYNLSLSQRRADSVRRYLVEAGVPGAQLSARGYGEAQPIDNNAMPEGRARNRRVVMAVLENPGEVRVQGEGQIN